MNDDLGWLDMAKDGDDIPNVTEPEIIRTLAVGRWSVRSEEGQIYIEASERLAGGEVRLCSRLATPPEAAADLFTQLARVLGKRRH